MEFTEKSSLLEKTNEDEDSSDSDYDLELLHKLHPIRETSSSVPSSSAPFSKPTHRKTLMNSFGSSFGSSGGGSDRFNGTPNSRRLSSLRDTSTGLRSKVRHSICALSEKSVRLITEALAHDKKVAQQELSHCLYHSFMHRASATRRLSVQVKEHVNSKRHHAPKPRCATNLSDVVTQCAYHSLMVYQLTIIRMRERRGELNIKLEAPLVPCEVLKCEDLVEFQQLQQGTEATLSFVPERMAQVVVLGDTEPTRPVYYIDLDKRNKVIHLAFRGSMTDNDWKMNLRLSMISVPDPTLDDDNAIVGIYKGMYEYLFGEYSSKAAVSNTYNEVLQQMQNILKSNPGFTVRATGHSMGGCLATLFAVFASREEWMPPIQVVTFGSPRIGDAAFVRTFRRLELAGKVIKLRVVNQGDEITTWPDLIMAPQRRAFHHVGIEVHLHTSRWDRGNEDATPPPIKIHYEHNPIGFWSALHRDFCNMVRRWSLAFWLLFQLVRGYPVFVEIPIMHDQLEYMMRADGESDNLARLDLQQLKSSFLGQKVVE